MELSPEIKNTALAQKSGKGSKFNENTQHNTSAISCKHQISRENKKNEQAVFIEV